MKTKTPNTKTTARTLPAVRTSCALDEVSGYSDDLPHVRGELEAECKVNGLQLTASISLPLRSGGTPLLYLSAGDCAEIAGAPGDVASLNAWISIFTSLRNALQREEPAMRAKIRAFDSFVRRHRAPRRRSA